MRGITTLLVLLVVLASSQAIGAPSGKPLPEIGPEGPPTAAHTAGPATPLDSIIAVDAACALLDAGKPKEALAALRALVAAAPGDCWLHAHLSAAYLKAGNPTFALQEAARAAELCPDDAVLESHLSWVLNRAGEWSDALELAPPGRAKRAGARRGYLHALDAYKAGRMDEALDLFGGLEDLGFDGIGAAAGLYLERIQSMMGRSKKLFSMDAVLGFDWDSNVILDPASADSPVSDTASFRGSGMIGMAFRPLRGNVTLEGRVRTYQSLHIADSARDFDTTWLDAGVGVKVISLANLDVGYDFGLFLLGGGPRVEQKDIYVFQEIHGAHLAADIANEKRFRITPRYTARGKFHDTGRRDVHEHTLDVTCGVFFLDGRLKLFIVPGGAYAETLGRVDSYDAWTARLQAGLTASLPHDISLLASLRGSWMNYLHSAGNFGIPERRVDQVLGANLSTSWAFHERFRLVGGYTFFRSFSTVSAYDYDRHTVGLSLGMMIF